MSSEAAALSAEFRTGAGPFLQHRRAVVALSVFSSAVLGGVALYQVGVLKKLPDPPVPHFDADAVNGSPEAYGLFETPDALLGMVSYAATACLAGMGRQSRWRETRWIPVAAAAKAALDASLAAKLGVEQWTKFRRFSFWSLLIAGATFAALPLTLGEARRAWRG